ncbi:sporulation histidine kinase inhibitor Sda [Neobacillus sp. NRS-1170]
MHKLSTEQLLEIYKDAKRFNINKDFIMLLTKEISKRLHGGRNIK